MKTVFSLLVVAAAAAQTDFSDDNLMLIQLRNAKHPRHDHEEALLHVGKTKMGGAQEEADEAQADAENALDAANNALNVAFQAEDDAQAAQDDAAAQANAAAPNAGTADEAEAVGDPHLKLSNGKKADLCCNGGHCKPCDALLFQYDHDQAEDKQVGDAQAEATQAQNEADDATNLANNAMQQANDAEAEANQAIADAQAENANPGQNDEAEAVGDPHMRLSNGKKADLCCDGHHCKKCPDALLQKDKMKDALADAQAAQAAAQEAQAVAQEAQDEAAEAQQQAQEAQEAVDDAQQAVAVPVAVDPAVQEEAAAVGDPHLTLNNGKKEDLCCKGKHCKPCHHRQPTAGTSSTSGGRGNGR